MGLLSNRRGVRHCQGSAADQVPDLSLLKLCSSTYKVKKKGIFTLDLIDFISNERLHTFKEYTDCPNKAVVLHNHTLQLGASLMSLIALFELSLRNGTNYQLTRDFGDSSWLLGENQSVPLKNFEKNAVSMATRQAKKSAYAKLSYREKGFLDAFAFPGGKPSNITHKQEVKARQELFVVSHGQIISQTTFGFWKRLYSSEYDAILWKPSLKKVFPNKNLKRSDITKALETVYATRNRVAHHEPVYGQRLVDAVDALELLRNSLGSKNVLDDTPFKKFSRIQYLRLRMDYESFLEAWSTLTV